MSELLGVAAQMFDIAGQRLEVAARNIANATTPGFKREMSFSQVVSSQETARSLGSSRPAISSDFEAGKLVPTGNPFDLSLGSTGFFEVNGPAGLEYTRNGHFTRDDAGRLTTMSGAVLQGAGGDVIVKSDRWSFERDGTVIDAGAPVDRLRIVDFANRAALTRSANGFSAGNEGALEVAEARVLQGSFEASNVSTASDMMHVMSAIRTGETAQKLVRIYDDMLGSALQRAGEIG